MPNPFHTSPDWLKAKATSTAQPEDPLSGVPQEYHKFHDVFSGEKANVLAPHQLYDLKINLEEGTKPFHRPIYLLLPPELTALRKFLEENIQNSSIHWPQPESTPRSTSSMHTTWYRLQKGTSQRQHSACGTDPTNGKSCPLA